MAEKETFAPTVVSLNCSWDHLGGGCGTWLLLSSGCGSKRHLDSQLSWFYMYFNIMSWHSIIPFILSHCLKPPSAVNSHRSSWNISDVVIYPSTLRLLCPPTRSGHRGSFAFWLLIGLSPGLGRANWDTDRGARQSEARFGLSNHLASRGPLKVTD